MDAGDGKEIAVDDAPTEAAAATSTLPQVLGPQVLETDAPGSGPAAQPENAATDAETSDAAWLAALLSTPGFNINETPDPDTGIPALHSCASEGETERLKLLLAAGADASFLAPRMHGWFEGTPPLHPAIEDDHAECVRLLLAAGANVEGRSRNGITPLVLAAEDNKSECMDLLLTAGADPNVGRQRWCERHPPLSIAIENDYTQCVDLLLAAGADANAVHVFRRRVRDVDTLDPELACRIYMEVQHVEGFPVEGYIDLYGTTPLFCAAELDHDRSVALLLAAGAEVNVASGHLEQTPLYIAAGGANHTSIERSDRCVEHLLAAGADVNATCQEGNTALHFASQYGRNRSVELLLAAGADPSVITTGADAQYTPLLMAAVHGNNRCTELLLAAGADVNMIIPASGITMLTAACLAVMNATEQMGMQDGRNIEENCGTNDPTRGLVLLLQSRRVTVPNMARTIAMLRQNMPSKAADPRSPEGGGAPHQEPEGRAHHFAGGRGRDPRRPAVVRGMPPPDPRQGPRHVHWVLPSGVLPAAKEGAVEVDVPRGAG